MKSERVRRTDMEITFNTMNEDNKLDDQTRIERWKWLYEETIRLFRLGADRGYNDFTLLKKANDILGEIEEEIL